MHYNSKSTLRDESSYYGLDYLIAQILVLKI